MTEVYVLTNQMPDYSAPAAAPISVHRTLEGAKQAYAGGKYTDRWTEAHPSRWYGPDGFGSIIRFELKE